jgi:hypothetical protein
MVTLGRSNAPPHSEPLFKAAELLVRANTNATLDVNTLCYKPSY